MKRYYLLILLCLSIGSAIAGEARLEVKNVNVEKIPPGKCLTVEWEQQPVSVCHRTIDQLKILKDANKSDFGDPDGHELIKSIAKLGEFHGSDYASYFFTMQSHLEGTYTRSLKPEYFISMDIDPYNGCQVTYRPDLSPPDLGKNWKGGFFDPCVGEGYDMAGRVLARLGIEKHDLHNYWNLRIPPYKFTSKNTIHIGELPDNYKLRQYDFSPDLYSKFYYFEQRLYLAALWGDNKAAEVILKKGVDPNKVDINGLYPLHMAILGNHIDTVKLLLKYGADPKKPGDKGITPLQFSQQLKRKEISYLFVGKMEPEYAKPGWEHRSR